VFHNATFTVFQQGYKFNEFLEPSSHGGSGGEPRYTGDPNRLVGGLAGTPVGMGGGLGVMATGKRQQGVDIIRTPTTPCKYLVCLLNTGPIKDNLLNCGFVPVHPNAPRGRIVVAVYTYQSREAADLSFSKGDRMEVLDDR